MLKIIDIARSYGTKAALRCAMSGRLMDRGTAGQLERKKIFNGLSFLRGKTPIKETSHETFLTDRSHLGPVVGFDVRLGK